MRAACSFFPSATFYSLFYDRNNVRNHRRVLADREKAKGLMVRVNALWACKSSHFGVSVKVFLSKTYLTVEFESV